MNLKEIYILCNERTKTIIQTLLDDFLPKRKPVATEYYYPQYSYSTSSAVSSIDEILDIMEKKVNESYSIYWDNLCDTNEIKSAMCFFNEDGSLIFGIVVNGSAEKWLIKFLKKFNIDFGYVNFDSPPLDSRNEFIESCHNSEITSLYEGKIS